MELWEDLERRIRERGVRVDERLALLELLRRGAANALDERRARLQQDVDRAARRLLEEAAGG